MTTRDAKSLHRTAQDLLVEYRASHGSPPAYWGSWKPIWGARVESITIERDSRPSSCHFWLPDVRWNSPDVPRFCDVVRVRNADRRAVVFAGFITSDRMSFSGGSDKRPGHEQIGFSCLDFRWLLGALSPIIGQYARTIDNYTSWPDDPRPGDVTWLNARRVIFNPDGVPNRDLAELKFLDPDDLDITLYEAPIFCNPSRDDKKAAAWTCRDMIRYLLSERNNKAFDYFGFQDPADIFGLTSTDFDKVLNHVVVDSLNVAEALEYICRQIGWGYRQENLPSGLVTLCFYRTGSATLYHRPADNRNVEHPTVSHDLYAPAVGADLTIQPAAGHKLLWSADVARDVGDIVNNPWGLGAPEEYEFTAELVPAWLDSDLVPDESGSDYKNLYFIDADLQSETSPDSHSFYRLYHSRGKSFRPTVGRKWALNETGTYTDLTGGVVLTYGRGEMFDFATVIDDKYAFEDTRYLDSEGEWQDGRQVRFGPFNRRLLGCLTPDNTGLNTAGITVEFSFDGGDSWQRIPCAIESLPDEAGILITDPNLSELFDKAEAKIPSGVLNGKPLNYWTSLCRDILDGNLFWNPDTESREWRTRLRVTASVQLDKRLIETSAPSVDSGSPFAQARSYDFSQNYFFRHRCRSSIYDGYKPSPNLNQGGLLKSHVEAIRAANEDMSISGRFVLDRLWLGDGKDQAEFLIGDVIRKISGRDVELSATWTGRKVVPEIVRVEYLPQKQQTVLFTRDLRFGAP